MLLIPISPVERDPVVRGGVDAIGDIFGICPLKIIAQLELVIIISSSKRQMSIPSLVLFLLQAWEDWCNAQICPVPLSLFRKESKAESEFRYAYLCHTNDFKFALISFSNFADSVNCSSSVAVSRFNFSVNGSPSSSTSSAPT